MSEPALSPPSTLSWRTGWLLPVALFCFLWLCYNANGRIYAGSDVYSSRFMPVNLALRGSYYFPGGRPWDLGTVVEDPASPSYNRMISVYHTYTPTLLLPVYIVFYRWLGVPEDHFLTFYLDKWFAAAFSAGAVTITFLLLRRLHGGRVGLPLLIAVAMGLGTSVWSMASQGSWSHGPSIFYLSVATWAMERAMRRAREGEWPAQTAWLVGWALASALVTRPSNFLFVVPASALLLWQWRRHWSLLAWSAAGAAPVAIWFALHNWIMFGSPLTHNFGYNLGVLRIPRLLHIENFPAAFVGLLFSPSLGMFTMGPVTLFALPALASVWRAPRTTLARGDDGTALELREPASPMLLMLRLGAVFCVAHVLFYSCFLQWWAGWSYCYRYLIEITPFIALLTGWFLRPGTRWRALRWPLMIPALVFSFYVQAYGAFFWAGTFYYGNTANDPRLYLDLRPDKGHAGIFNHPSAHYSLLAKNHIILAERPSFRWSWSTWDSFIAPFATPREVYRDLFITQRVEFRWGPPIILTIGQRRAE